jgi:hypothetical protein
MSTYNREQKTSSTPGALRLPFALPIVEGKKFKKKCCKKYKKGKRCKRCPNG